MRRLLCECGQRVYRKDIVQQEYYFRQFGPSFVYLKYRCARCNRLGERYLRQEDWQPSVLDSRRELKAAAEERALISQQGPITEAEHATLREQLAFTNPLDSLIDWIRQKPSG
jgi:hypothetical protein